MDNNLELEADRAAAYKENHPTGDPKTDAAIHRAEMSATYKGELEMVRISKSDLLLILKAARA